MARTRTVEGVPFHCDRPGRWFCRDSKGNEIELESGRRGWTWCYPDDPASIKKIFPNMKAAIQDILDVAYKDVPLPYVGQTVDVVLRDKLDVEAILKASAERKKQRLEEARALATPRDEPTGKECPVCKAPIVARYRHRPITRSRPIVYGGSQNSFESLPKPCTVNGYHCSGCSIEFHRTIKGDPDE